MPPYLGPATATDGCGAAVGVGAGAGAGADLGAGEGGDCGTQDAVAAKSTAVNTTDRKGPRDLLLNTTTPPTLTYGYHISSFALRQLEDQHECGCTV